MSSERLELAPLSSREVPDTLGGASRGDVLGRLVTSHRVVVVAGAGGVGKTTTAAALGLIAASRGKRVLCLTIDPARRLAEALGLQRMSGDEQAIAPALFEAVGLPMKGSLTAMMLD